MTTCLHDFGPDWPFAEPVNRLAITTTRVLHQHFPVLLVTHDDDGSWQVLCGTTNDPKDGVAVCLGCMFKLDRSLATLADLPLGWLAWREAATEPWLREAQGPEEPDPTP